MGWGRGAFVSTRADCLPPSVVSACMLYYLLLYIYLYLSISLFLYFSASALSLAIHCDHGRRIVFYVCGLPLFILWHLHKIRQRKSAEIRKGTTLLKTGSSKNIDRSGGSDSGSASSCSSDGGILTRCFSSCGQKRDASAASAAMAIDGHDGAHVDFTFLSEDYKDEGLLYMWEFAEIVRKLLMSLVGVST